MVANSCVIKRTKQITKAIMSNLWHTFFYLFLLCALVFFLSVCFCTFRDDTTGSVCQIVTGCLSLEHDDVQAQSTLGELGCTKAQFACIVKEMEEFFSVTISMEDDPRIDVTNDAWKEIRVIDLAEIVRPEWIKGC